MNSTDPTKPGTVVIRYANLSGALVTVSHRAPREGRSVAYGAECTACLDDSGASINDSLTAARTWANKHATGCRALPQPEPQA
jgi:hypothetical protein